MSHIFDAQYGESKVKEVIIKVEMWNFWLTLPYYQRFKLSVTRETETREDILFKGGFQFKMAANEIGLDEIKSCRGDLNEVQATTSFIENQDERYVDLLINSKI